jgi:hypothetical protein
MSRIWTIRLGAVIALSFLVTPWTVSATEQYMLKLPAYHLYRCGICHVAPQPTPGDAKLNPFGVDFRKNGFTWDATLAAMNSDGDRCSNGFELRDQDGDGIVDGPGIGERGNPGERDCSISLTESSWGIIKEIFSE